MPTLLITGPARSGKTSLAAGLLACARDVDRSAAYAKPFSADGDADADHAFASGVLADALGVAVGPAPGSLADDMEDAAAAIAQLRDQVRTVIVEVTDGAPGAELAEATDARVLEVHAYAAGQDWAATADRAAGRWGNRLAALVVNAVPPYRGEAVAVAVAESSAAVDAVLIPESRVMLAPTVAQIADHLEAVWTLEPVNADAPVERFLIGGNIMDNGPTYYGRYANQAVITRTQRPDIQLASMLPQTRCLVLTGPGEPIEYVKAEARERDIPLLQVFASTIETADALDRLIDAVTPHSLAKVRHYAALLEQHAGPETLDGWLG
jgi:BioD-like phosphotransacetylase family protein